MLSIILFQKILFKYSLKYLSFPLRWLSPLKISLICMLALQFPIFCLLHWVYFPIAAEGAKLPLVDLDNTNLLSHRLVPKIKSGLAELRSFWNHEENQPFPASGGCLHYKAHDLALLWPLFSCRLSSDPIVSMHLWLCCLGWDNSGKSPDINHISKVLLSCQVTSLQPLGIRTSLGSY